MALGRKGPSNVDKVINDFVARSSGTYYVRVTGAPADYEGMIERFLTGVAADSGNVGGSASNVFSNLPQFAMETTPGGVTPGAYFRDAER